MKFRLPLMKRFQEPIAVRCLKDRIRSHEDLGNVVIIIPKDACFEKLLVKSSRSLATLFENLEELYCTSTVIPAEKMTDETRTLYRKLKGMEFELEWKMQRVLKRKAQFKPYGRLLNLQAYIPELTVSDAVWKSLYRDSHFMRLLNAVKPEELSLTLSSLDTGKDITVPRKDTVYWSALDYYYNPVEIKWEARLTKVLPRLVFYKKNYIGMYDLMDMLCETARETTQQMITTAMKGG